MINTKYLIGAVIILLTLWGCGNDSDYIIESNPNEFAIFPVAIPVSANGGSYELTINGNESWTAELTNSNSSAKDWCTLSETSGSGRKVITINVKPTTSFVKNRSVIVEVSSNTKILKTKILQETMVLGEDEVLINGLVWSTKNVGTPGTFATSPDDIGQLYQFNRKVGYPAGPQDDPAPANWPSNYTNDDTNLKDGVCLPRKRWQLFGKKEQHGLQHPRPDLRPTVSLSVLMRLLPNVLQKII
mgnify:CR=1 FL=1